jgi:3-phenylpropionate/cinnamic acid dioxygenase small subunit
MDKLSRLAARAEIEDVLCRYARGVDRRDWDAVRSCYYEDAIDEHGEFCGTVNDFIDWVSKRHANIPFSAHFLGNCLVEFVDDRTAFVETYFVAMQRRAASSATVSGNGYDESSELDAEVIGRYLDRFECRDAAWKVAKRCVVYDSSRLVPSTHKPRTAKGTLGMRTAHDPVFTWMKKSHPAP